MAKSACSQTHGRLQECLTLALLVWTLCTISSATEAPNYADGRPWLRNNRRRLGARAETEALRMTRESTQGDRVMKKSSRRKPPGTKMKISEKVRVESMSGKGKKSKTREPSNKAMSNITTQRKSGMKSLKIPSAGNGRVESSSGKGKKLKTGWPTKESSVEANSSSSSSRSMSMSSKTSMKSGMKSQRASSFDKGRVESISGKGKTPSVEKNSSFSALGMSLSKTSNKSGMKSRRESSPHKGRIESSSGKGRKSKARSSAKKVSSNVNSAAPPPSSGIETFCQTYPKVSDRREWPASNFFDGEWYLKTFQLRGLGDHIEIWVADDTAFPDPSDCRNVLNLTEVTDEQVANFVHEFDTAIYPSITREWLVPTPRNGTQIPNLNNTFAENVTDCTFQGDGRRIVTLVDNVKDQQFYAPLNGQPMPFTLGLYNSQLDHITDRSIMTIDAYDWLHRTSANPPDDTDNQEYQPCATLIGRNNTFESQPYTYESTFAHEFGHLLDSFVEGERETWLGEMLAEYASYLTGYRLENLLLDPADPDFEMVMSLFLGFFDEKSYGGPEQSLSSWLDQGQPEILADYSAIRGFGLYLTGRYGRSFLGEFSTVPNATNLQDLQDFLTAKGVEDTIQDIIQDWLVASAVSGEISQGAILESTSRVEANLVMPLVPLSRVNWDTYQAYNSSGAPNHGADFVRFRGESGLYVSANEVQRIDFSGSLTYEPDAIEWMQDVDALYSGSGDNLNRVILREITIPEDGAKIAFDMSWEIELGYDFFDVSLLADGQWTPLFTNSVPPDSTSEEPLSSLSGSSRGEIVTQIYDASAFAGETTYLALRYVTDETNSEDGVRLYGMAFLNDDGDSTGWIVEDATDIASWVSETSAFPFVVDEWVFTLVAYTPGGHVVRVNDIPLDANGMAVLVPPALDNLIGSDAEVVAAIVSVGAIDDTTRDYAHYELKVNGVVQPGGSQT